MPEYSHFIQQSGARVRAICNDRLRIYNDKPGQVPFLPAVATNLCLPESAQLCRSTTTHQYHGRHAPTHTIDDGSSHTRMTLASYDIGVLGLSNLLAWRCSPSCRSADLLLTPSDSRAHRHQRRCGLLLSPRLLPTRYNLHNPRRQQCLDPGGGGGPGQIPPARRANSNGAGRLRGAPAVCFYLLNCVRGPPADGAALLVRLRRLPARTGVPWGAMVLGRGVQETGWEWS